MFTGAGDRGRVKTDDEGYDGMTKEATMSRFTFGLLLGAGAGWAVGSGKAKEWKQTIEERRAPDVNASFDAVGTTSTIASPVVGVAPEFGTPQDVAAL